MRFIRVQRNEISGGGRVLVTLINYCGEKFVIKSSGEGFYDIPN
jgi:hypothetical protein